MIRRKPSQDYKLYLVKNLPNLKNTDANGIIDEIEKKEERKEKILSLSFIIIYDIYLKIKYIYLYKKIMY